MFSAADEVRARLRQERAYEIWEASQPLEGSPAEAYLRKRLAGEPIPDAVYEGDALRWNPRERLPGTIGAMVGLMTDPLTNRPTGIHRTYVTADLRRHDRRQMLGRQGVARLWPDEAVTLGLTIGEGIETTLAGVIVSRYSPVWAALSAGQVKTFPVLSGIEFLTIFVDNDESGTGQEAALACSNRWSAAGRVVGLITPKKAGADMGDILTGAA